MTPPPLLFSPVYPSSSPLTWGEKNIKLPSLPLPATLFIRLLALIPVKGKFCTAWLLNLISLFLIPHSVIKLMVCVLSASLFTCAYPSFIESSWSLNPGSSSRLLGNPLFTQLLPLLLAIDKMASHQEHGTELAHHQTRHVGSVCVL